LILQLKIKLLIIYLIIYYFFINPILHFVIQKNKHLINDYDIYSKKFLRFKENPLNLNDSLISDEKRSILKLISSTIKRKISSVKRIVCSGGLAFGNNLLCINKLIFFCEIIKCNEIVLEGPSFWFIKNNITLGDYNITINKIKRKNHLNNYNDRETVYCTSSNIYYYLPKIKPKINIHLLKNEIIKNLPRLSISKNDLYIYIRSGDIFSTARIHRNYAQPPLCFYKNIFYNFNFTSVYLISQSQNNPTVNKLISKYKNIIYQKQKLEYDLSCLINSYNLVGASSSFLMTILMLNSNLVNFYEYNLYQISEKIFHAHYDLFEFPKHFSIYRMEPSANYKYNMRIWKNNRKQRILMIKEKCINPFTIMKI
jgi:hypothetical protein